MKQLLIIIILTLSFNLVWTQTFELIEMDEFNVSSKFIVKTGDDFRIIFHKNNGNSQVFEIYEYENKFELVNKLELNFSIDNNSIIRQIEYNKNNDFIILTDNALYIWNGSLQKINTPKPPNNNFKRRLKFFKLYNNNVILFSSIVDESKKLPELINKDVHLINFDNIDLLLSSNIDSRLMNLTQNKNAVTLINDSLFIAINGKAINGIGQNLCLIFNLNNRTVDYLDVQRHYSDNSDVVILSIKHLNDSILFGFSKKHNVPANISILNLEKETWEFLEEKEGFNLKTKKLGIDVNVFDISFFDNKYWIGGGSGLYVYNNSTTNFIDLSDSTNDLNNNIISEIKSNNSVLWGRSGNDLFRVDLKTSEIEEVSFDSQITFHPNPTNGELTINLNKEMLIKEYSIYDLKGKLINKMNKLNNGKKINLNISDYPIGIYLVRIDFGENIKTYKIIKK